jgi:hypothetical protein
VGRQGKGREGEWEEEGEGEERKQANEKMGRVE